MSRPIDVANESREHTWDYFMIEIDVIIDEQQRMRADLTNVVQEKNSWKSRSARESATGWRRYLPMNAPRRRLLAAVCALPTWSAPLKLLPVDTPSLVATLRGELARLQDVLEGRLGAAEDALVAFPAHKRRLLRAEEMTPQGHPTGLPRLPLPPPRCTIGGTS